MPKKNAPHENLPNPRETVSLNTATREQLTKLHEKYPWRTKSDLINAAIEHLFLSGYFQGLDGNLLPNSFSTRMIKKLIQPCGI